jgi:isopenicillin-N N-acyltransferase-like protein
MAELYEIELRGSSRQRGLQHGRQLTTSIQRAVDFYRAFFKEHIGLDTATIRQRAAHFIEPTAQISPLLMDEYEGIAEGSGQSLEDIFALSARYEITFEAVALGECSNLFVGPQRSRDGHVLLGQNWDWRPEVMDFRAVFTARCDDLPDHIMVTECGQPGKYGLNASGLGIAEAGLNCRSKASIGPHLFVAIGRAILACDTLDAAAAIIEQFPPYATVNFLLADEQGQAVNFEATPVGIFRKDLPTEQIFWHTNHCLQADEPTDFENSLARGHRWTELTSTPDTVTPQMAQAWLADRGLQQHNICQLPDPALAATPTWLQTLCSIVMDLNQRTLWVSDGPSCQFPYREYQL